MGDRSERKKGQNGVFHSIVEAVSKTMNLPTAVWILDERSQCLRIEAAVGLRPSYIKNAYLALDEPSVTGQAFKKKETVIAPDISSDPRWKYTEEAETMGWKSVLCVPIMVPDEVVGVISIYTFVARGFTDLEKQLLTDYASQIGLTIETDRRRKTLARLLDVGHEFERLITREPRIVLQEIVEGACEVTGADCAVIYPYDAVREEFYAISSVAHHGLQHHLELKDKPRKEGLGAYLVQEKELVRADIEQEDPDMLKSPFIDREGIKAFMGIALEIAGRTLGILYVDFRTPHEFGDEEKNTVRLFAHQAALAIDNSRLYQQAKTRAEALEKLHEISPALVSITDVPGSLEKILLQIVENAQSVLGADLVDLYQYIQTRDEYVLPPIQAGERYEPRVRKDVIYKDDVIRALIQDRHPQYISEAQQETTLTQPFHVKRPDVPSARFVIREDVKSTAAIPLIAGTEMVGVLFANYRSPQAFSQQQQDLIELFASQAAIAIRNTRLLRQRQVLQDIAHDISSLLDKDELMQRILQRSLELLGCGIGSIALLNTATSHLDYQYSIGKEGYPSIPFGQGLIGTAAETRKVVRVGDTLKDPRYIKQVEETRSELDVPLLIGDRLVGVLNTESPHYDAFSDEDERLALILGNHAAVAMHNAELFQQTQQRLDERLGDLQALQDVYEAIGQVSLEEILRLITERAVSLTPAQYGNLWLLDRARQELRFGVEVDPQNMLTRRSDRIPVDEHSINGWVVLTGLPYLCDNVTTDKHYQMISDDTRSELAVPLRRGEQIIGTLNLESVQPTAFTPDHKRLLEALAGQAAIAIDNARFYDRLDTLVRVGRTVTSTLDLDEILDLAMQESFQTVGADRGTLRLLHHTTGELELKAHRGEIGDRSKETIRSGEGVVGWVAEHGEPLLIPDVEKDDRYVEYLAGTHSEVAVPIQFEGRTIGVLNIEHLQPHAFDEHDMHLLEAIASQAALSIRNAQLYEREYQRAHVLQILGQVGQSLTSGLRLREDEILKLIHAQASELMDTDNMYVALYDEVTDTVRFGLALVDGKRVDVEKEEGWQPRQAGKGRTEHIIRTRQPIFAATKAESEAWYALPDHQEYLSAGQDIWNSWLGVPMVVGDRVLGVIATYHKTQDYVYSEDDLEILQAMASQAAIAIDNARLFYGVNRRLETLGKVGLMLTSGLRLGEDEILKLIHAQASELMDTDNMYIALYDEATDTVRFELAFVDGKRVDVEKEADWQPRQAGKGRTEQIIHTRQPIFTATKAESEAWYALPEHKEYIGEPFASWLGVPMVVGDRVLGVIATYHKTQDYVYDSGNQEILQGIANQASVALENASLYEQVRTLYEQARGEVIASKQLATLGTAMAALQHRINNTFNIIVPNLMRLRRRIDMTDPTIAEIVDIIERNARYTSDIVRRILEPLQAAETQQVDINAVLNDVVNEAKELRKDSTKPFVKVKLDLDESIPPIQAPIGQIAEVFSNLVDNAYRAMPKGGQLVVASEIAEDKICVRVQDTGIGIPAQIRQRLFIKSVPSKELGGGAGLGLWLSQLVLQSIGGCAIIEKSDKNGTTMMVQIPLPAAEGTEVLP